MIICDCCKKHDGRLVERHCIGIRPLSRSDATVEIGTNDLCAECHKRIVAKFKEDMGYLINPPVSATKK